MDNISLYLAKHNRKKFCQEIEEICTKYENVPYDTNLFTIADGMVIATKALDSQQLKEIYYGSDNSISSPIIKLNSPSSSECNLSDVSDESSVCGKLDLSFGSKNVNLPEQPCKDWDTMSAVSVSHFQGISRVYSKALNCDDCIENYFDENVTEESSSSTEYSTEDNKQTNEHSLEESLNSSSSLYNFTLKKNKKNNINSKSYKNDVNIHNSTTKKYDKNVYRLPTKSTLSAKPILSQRQKINKCSSKKNINFSYLSSGTRFKNNCFENKPATQSHSKIQNETKHNKGDPSANYKTSLNVYNDQAEHRPVSNAEATSLLSSQTPNFKKQYYRLNTSNRFKCSSSNSSSDSDNGCIALSNKSYHKSEKRFDKYRKAKPMMKKKENKFLVEDKSLPSFNFTSSSSSPCTDQQTNIKQEPKTWNFSFSSSSSSVFDEPANNVCMNSTYFDDDKKQRLIGTNDKMCFSSTPGYQSYDEKQTLLNTPCFKTCFADSPSAALSSPFQKTLVLNPLLPKFNVPTKKFHFDSPDRSPKILSSNLYSITSKNYLKNQNENSSWLGVPLQNESNINERKYNSSRPSLSDISSNSLNVSSFSADESFEQFLFEAKKTNALDYRSGLKFSKPPYITGTDILELSPENEMSTIRRPYNIQLFTKHLNK